MKATYKGKVADVWKIIKENVESYPNWVKEAFEKNYLYWLDNHLRILMAGLNPSTARNLKLESWRRLCWLWYVSDWLFRRLS